MGWGEERGWGDLAGDAGVYTERGTQIEEQILGGRQSDILGLLFLKGLQGHPGFFGEESVMVLLDVTSAEAPIPGWRLGMSGAFPAASAPLSSLGF